MKKKDHDFGHDVACEVDERRIAHGLGRDAGVGVGGDFQDADIGLGLARAANLEHAVGIYPEPPTLSGLKGRRNPAQGCNPGDLPRPEGPEEPSPGLQPRD